MVQSNSAGPSTPAFAVFTRTLCEGLVPAWYDDHDKPVTYVTQREAQCEIAEMLVEQLRQFLDGEREFDDAMSVDDFVLPVDLLADGTILTEDGEKFGRRIP